MKQNKKSLIKIGLTGGIGSGKSTISNMIKSMGIPVVDADIVAREVLILYPEILEKIISTFGDEFVDKKGKLKRREFGNYIFKDIEKRKTFENIIIPFIKKEIYRKLELLDNKKEKLCIVDAPTLIENNMDKEMDYNILVWVNKEIQIQRVMKRDLLSLEQTLNRINSQMSLEDKKKHVNFIIDNSKDIKNSKKQLDEIFNIINKLLTGGEKL